MTTALSDYANKAGETGRAIGDALVSAFSGAEDALVAFVSKGKLDFAGLADAVLADITRIAVRSAILGPLATALGGAFGGAAGGGGLLAGRFHGGGVVGETGATRMMPAAALAVAPRYHAGGTAGLTTPPAAGTAITADFEFDVPVRFDTDAMALSLDSYERGSWQQILIQEIRP